jgi:two-component system, NtrC family, sensor kinase
VVGRPLQTLGAAMELVGAGGPNVRAEELGPIELRQLARHFNAMLDALHQKDADLAARRAQHERLEARLRESEKYAMVGRLASGVAHELGTPLAVVDGHAQKLARIAAPDTPAAQAAAGIRNAVARMSTVIRQLLGFGRASHAARSDVSLRQLVMLTATDMSERCRAEGTELDVVDGGDDCMLRSADPGRLREALGHLVRNGCQAAPGGRVRIGWTRRGGEPAVFVEDSGPGVDDETRKRMFDPFFTTKPPGEGSGLGLAIVLGIAADHDAELFVYRSESLGGAGFEMRFRRDG